MLNKGIHYVIIERMASRRVNDNKVHHLPIQLTLYLKAILKRLMN